MNKQVPLWTLILASTLAILFLCGITGAVASKPEPETKIVTEYKTRTVTKKVPGETKYELPPECRTALVSSTQNMADFNQLVGDIGNAIVSFSETYDTSKLEGALAQQKVVTDDMLAAIKQTMTCDPTIGQDVTIPGQ